MTTESKITAIIVLTVIIAVYHFQQWNSKDNLVDCPDQSDVCLSRHLSNDTDIVLPKQKNKPVVRRDVCRVIDVLTLRERPEKLCRAGELREKLRQPQESSASTVTIVVLLLLLSLKSVHDVVRQRREEAARRAREPEESRRRSLAEFADKKSRRDSKLFRLPEPFRSSCRVMLTRGDSDNSYLVRTAAAAGEEDSLRAKRISSPRQLLGARPAPMLRRSSFPVLPHGGGGATDAAHAPADSEDENDPRMRRVRLIRRR